MSFHIFDFSLIPSVHFYSIADKLFRSKTFSILYNLLVEFWRIDHFVCFQIRHTWTGIQINILLSNILINILILPISISILVFVKEQYQYQYQYCNIRAIYSSNMKKALFSNNSRFFWQYIAKNEQYIALAIYWFCNILLDQYIDLAIYCSSNINIGF